MISSIGNIASMHRPDPSQMASKLFSKLDTKNQGYIEKGDLQSAFNQISGTGNSGNTASVDDIFSRMDSNGDGKVTKDEMTSSLQKLADQLDSQFNNMRASGKGSGMGGMPPPPPPQSSDGAGFSKDELQSQLDKTGTSDSKRSSLLSNIINNFDKADTNGDGKVSAQEAMAFEQASQTSASASATDSGNTTNTEANIMKRIMQLMHAYGLGHDSGQASSTGTLSVTA